MLEQCQRRKGERPAFFSVHVDTYNTVMRSGPFKCYVILIAFAPLICVDPYIPTRIAVLERPIYDYCD